MIKELVTDEGVLSTPCEPATADDAQLATDLVDTLTSMDDAACLAANQIGATKAVVAYLDEKEQPRVMFNPKVLFGVGAYKAEEGCLTRPEPSRVTRFNKVKIGYQELVDGELVKRQRDFRGWQAQLVQHMVDHCKGKLV